MPSHLEQILTALSLLFFLRLGEMIHIKYLVQNKCSVVVDTDEIEDD